jgi:signal-transduction protein with cAMP-binding, CBS, and nucleotidyltransferase domain
MSSTNHRMTAAELCIRTVVVTDRRTPLPQAARLMREQHVGSLVVVDETPDGRQVAGLLTDRDIVTAVVAREVPAATLRVDDVMSADVVCADENDSLHDVLAIMKSRRVRRIPVTGPQRRLIGVIAYDDAVRTLADELHSLAHALGEQVQVEQITRP